VGLRRSPPEWKRRPAQIKSGEKEKVPGVGDWSPSNGKISQMCLKATEFWEFSFLVYVCIPDLCKICPFIGLQTKAPPSITSLLCPLIKGIVSLDGTRRSLSVFACVNCYGAFMTLCAYPHVGYYKAAHFFVSHLMPATTHLMCIKCGDSLYLLTRAARLDTVCPPRMNWIRAALIWQTTYSALHGPYAYFLLTIIYYFSSKQMIMATTTLSFFFKLPLI
jgi:hypothetical protein